MNSGIQLNNHFKLENQNIVYFANDFNTDNKTSSHQNAKILSEKNTIFYVEVPGLRKVRFEKHDLNRISTKIKSFFKGAQQINERFFLYTLLLIPTDNRLLKIISRSISVWALKTLLKKYRITNPILWIAVPHVEPILVKLQHKFSVYYCVDEYTELPGVDKKRIEKLEKRLIKSVSIVYVTSKALMINKQKIRSDIMYSPHFVDFIHFNKAYTLDILEPDDMKPFRGKIIGFMGLIEHWFDFELLNFLAKENKAFDFVLLGRLAVDYTPEYSNIHLLGKKDYSLLPNYLKFFDACIIPFKVNETTKYVNPIKLKEYLASGRPVVSTYMPELTDYENLIEIAEIDNYHDFNHKLHEVLSADNEFKIKERIKSVKEYDWSNKIYFFEKTINSVIK